MKSKQKTIDKHQEKIDALIKLIPTTAEQSYQPDFDAFACTATITKAIDTLTPLQQIVIHMRYFEDKTLKEIADYLGVTAPGIRIAQEAALRTLRKPVISTTLAGFLTDLSPDWRAKMDIQQIYAKGAITMNTNTRNSDHENRAHKDQETINRIVAATQYKEKTFIGKILTAPTPKSIAQHIGRGKTIIHLTKYLDNIPATGDLATIQYDANGHGTVSKDPH